EGRLGVEPPGRADNDDVAAALGGELDRVVGDGGRIAAPFAADEIRAGAFRPDLELLLRSGAEGVGRAQDDRASVLAQAVCELPDRRRLPGAVDTDHKDDARLSVEGERPGLAEQGPSFLHQRLA